MSAVILRNLLSLPGSSVFAIVCLGFSCSTWKSCLLTICDLCASFLRLNDGLQSSVCTFLVWQLTGIVIV
jgi:hypothetical protein